MKDREHIINLFEEYKLLLTDKQVSYFNSYYYEDLSLNEIAELNGVTKSLVGKTISNIETKLIIYENKLKLNEKMNDLKKVILKETSATLRKELEAILYK